MIWGYPYFWKHPYDPIGKFESESKSPLSPNGFVFFPYIHLPGQNLTHFRLCNQKHVAPTMGGGGGCIFKYHLCGGFKSMESYHLFFVDVFVKPSCSLPDPKPLKLISKPPPPRVKCQCTTCEWLIHQAQEKLLDGRPSSVGEFSHIGQFQVGVWSKRSWSKQRFFINVS